MYRNKKLIGGYDPYKGMPYQRGYGIGGTFRKFFRWVVPIFKKHAMPAIKSSAKIVGNEALSSISDISKNIIEGNDIKSSVKKRLNKAVDTLKEKVETSIEGNGIKKRKLQKKIIEKNQKKQKRKYLDIFT